MSRSAQEAAKVAVQAKSYKINRNKRLTIEGGLPSLVCGARASHRVTGAEGRAAR